jgi:hypothetical protein
MKTPEIHVLKLPKRTGKLEITEEPSRVVFKLCFTKYGDFGDVLRSRSGCFHSFENTKTIRDQA